ncbi:MAG: arsenate reductase family protein [Chitinophagaceae bacterium]
MYTLFGIKNCNTVKNAVDWLKANNISFEFHDYKKLGVSVNQLTDWHKQVNSINELINTKGTTWKQLPDEEKKLSSVEQAMQLMQEKTSVIKRPIITDANGKIIVIGFNEANYQSIFKL